VAASFYSVILPAAGYYLQPGRYCFATRHAVGLSVDRPLNGPVYFKTKMFLDGPVSPRYILTVEWSKIKIKDVKMAKLAMM